MIKERLIEFIKTLNISIRQFEIAAGLSNGQVNNIGDSLRRSTLEKISKVYPQLNITWVLSGVGEMITNENTDEYLSRIQQNNIIEASSKLDELKVIFNKLADIKNEKQHSKESCLDDIIIDEDEVIDESSLTVSEVYKFVLKQNRVILNLSQKLEELKQEIADMKNDFRENIYL